MKDSPSRRSQYHSTPYFGCCICESALYNGTHSICIFLSRDYSCVCCSIIFRCCCCKQSCLYISSTIWVAMLCIISSELLFFFVYSRFDFIFLVLGVHIGQAQYICACTTICVVRVDFNGRLPLLQQANVFVILRLLYVYILIFSHCKSAIPRNSWWCYFCNTPI